MVRRSTVDRSPQPDLYSTGYDPGTGTQQARNGKRPRSGSGWRGAGGRWLVWTFRVVVWAVLLIIGYRGVMAIVLNETPPSKTPPAPAATADSGFPVQGASAYALAFGQVYLNASPATATQRASELAPFLPPGTPDQQLGWNGGGSLNLQSEQVADVRVQDAQHAVVTLLARVNGNMMGTGRAGLCCRGRPGNLRTARVAARAEARRAARAAGGQHRLRRRIGTDGAASRLLQGVRER